MIGQRPDLIWGPGSLALVNAPAVSPGLFVCFEGGDGSGKSTQSRLLAAHLQAAGREAVLTFEPGDTEVGQLLRKIVLSPETGDLDARAEVLIYAADKAEHLHRVVLPALARGAVVVTDRYVDSSLAYQGAGRALEMSAVEQVLRFATRDLRPDLTIVLDLAPETGLGRFAGRDRIEAESDEFHQRVRAAFVRMAAEDPAHYLVLDARISREEIATAVAARVDALVRERAGAPGHAVSDPQRTMSS